MKKWMKTSLIVALLFVSSCICFEKQTLVMRYDSAKDLLLIFQLYEGIYGENSEEALNADETREIASVLEGERTFFFANWILEYDRSGIEEELDDLSRKSGGADSASTASKRYATALGLGKLLLENVEVKNGRFFLNAEKKLSGYQLVTVKNASKIAAAANQFLSALILDPSTRPTASEDGWSEESIRLLVTAAEKGHAWFTLDENRIRFRLPCSYGDFGKARRKVAGALEEALAAAESRESRLAKLIRRFALALRGDLWISYGGDAVEFALGHTSCERVQLSGEPFDSEYKPNVVPFAEQHGGVAGSLDFREVMEAFLAGEAK